MTGNPVDVIVNRASAATGIFRVDNSNAALRFLTIAGGQLHSANNAAQGIQKGAGVYLTSGAVEDCIVSNCLGRAYGQTGIGIQAEGGRISRCRVTRNNCSNESCSGVGIYASGSTLVEDSLVDNNDCKQGGAVYLAGSATFLNGTVVKNKGTTYAGVKVGSNTARVANCAIFGNTVQHALAGTVYADGYGACFDHCAADLPIEGGVDCLFVQPVFRDVEHGDYRPIAGSPLLDAGIARSGKHPAGLARAHGHGPAVGLAGPGRALGGEHAAADELEALLAGAPLGGPALLDVVDGPHPRALHLAEGLLRLCLAGGEASGNARVEAHLGPAALVAAAEALVLALGDKTHLERPAAAPGLGIEGGGVEGELRIGRAQRGAGEKARAVRAVGEEFDGAVLVEGAPDVFRGKAGVGLGGKAPVEAPEDFAALAKGVGAEVHGTAAADGGLDDHGMLGAGAGVFQGDGAAGPHQGAHRHFAAAYVLRPGVFGPGTAQPAVPVCRRHAHVALEAHGDALLLGILARPVVAGGADEGDVALPHPAADGIDDLVPAALDVADDAADEQLASAGHAHGRGLAAGRLEDGEGALASGLDGPVDGKGRGALGRRRQGQASQKRKGKGESQGKGSEHGAASGSGGGARPEAVLPCHCSREPPAWHPACRPLCRQGAGRLLH
ncbi:MAG: right-handed parallel beta-helix repeat-containing protein [Desulfovibrio sp.]|nr:right-handed parallel beta-helix repeat-containing protein [Desulfovibrio sp.]